MDYAHTISTFIITNKWSIIFILFAIFAAYSLGVQYASTRKAESFAEGFKTSCGTDVGIPVEPEVPSITPKPITVEKPKLPELPKIDKQRKIVIIKGAENHNNRSEEEDEDEDEDDDTNNTSNNCPNMKDYVSKNAVRKRFVSKRVVNENYVKKEDCLAEIEKNKKALKEIRDSLEKKREAHMERERQDLERQKQILIEQREKLRIIKEKYEKQQNDEVCDKKISNIKKKIPKPRQEDEDESCDDDASVDNDTELSYKQPRQQPRQQYRKQNPVPLMKTANCDDDDEINRKPAYNPYANSHKQLPEMLKQQDMFDKNRTAMDDNYNYLNDAYSTCNLGNCTINGLPGGLKPRS